MRIFDNIRLKQAVRAGWLVLLLPIGATAANLQEFEHRYNVSVKGRNAGVAELALNRIDENTYRLATTLVPNQAAKLLGAEQSEDAIEFSPENNNWRVKSYRQQRRGRKAGITEVKPNGDRHYVLNLDGKQVIQINRTLIEPQTFPISIMLLRKKQLENRQIMLIRRNGFRAHVYRNQGPETVEVQGKTYETTRWKRQDASKNYNWYTIWVDERTDIPVRIQRNKKGSKTTLELIE